eukprot:CAMPEP_0194359414 /NCGR_PEP_ID=MMETSP0174-20130528/6652_1 /TAXON_ID=216777 /ORGANISM="Proboscia alata, Strain PI-D3" /LENGTH=532 /DNA_ID=CAMNT_0039130287 /DNA_START=40 /DNA_END=1634 /DNA_ORIENTATION=+
MNQSILRTASGTSSAPETKKRKGVSFHHNPSTQRVIESHKQRLSDKQAASNDDDEEDGHYLPASRKRRAQQAAQEQQQHDNTIMDDDYDSDDAMLEADAGSGLGADASAALAAQQIAHAKKTRRNRDNDDDDELHDDAGVEPAQATTYEDESKSKTTLEEEEKELGETLEPFNLNEERDGGDGCFVGDTYVFRRNAAGGGGLEPDAWIDGLEELDSSRKKGDKTDSFLLKKRAPKEESKGVDVSTPQQRAYACYALSALLGGKESVMQGLSRYGAIVTKCRKTIKIKKRQKQLSLTSTTTRDETDSRAAADIMTQLQHAEYAMNQLIGYADALLMNSTEADSNNATTQFVGDDTDETEGVAMTDIYEKNKEELVQLYTSLSSSLANQKKRSRGYFETATSTTTTATKTDTSSSLQWEYKGRADNAIHGPYTCQQMEEWRNAGYFVGESSVWVRPCCNSTHETTTNVATKKLKKESSSVVDDFMADLEESDDDDNDNEKVTEKSNKNEQDMDTTDNNDTTVSNPPNEWMRSDT